MKLSEQITPPISAQDQAPLDVVVPFTTPELTRAALDAANRLGAALHAAILLVKIQLIPYPLDLRQSPVPLEFLREQLRSLKSEIPINREIRLARDFEQGLTGALHDDSLVVLATRRRPWKTSTERLAVSLRRAGYRVIVVSKDGKDNNA